MPAPMTAAVKSDGLLGASIDTTGYDRPQRSWLALMVMIAAGFLPSGLMISRTVQRRRDGPVSRLD